MCIFQEVVPRSISGLQKKELLLGRQIKINKIIQEYNLDLPNCTIIDPRSDETIDQRERFAKILHEKRKRRGLTFYEAKKMMRERNYYASAMVETGIADVMISGITRSYKETIRPALQVIGAEEGINKIAGMYILISKDGPIFFADTTININPTIEEIVDITLLVARTVKEYKSIEKRSCDYCKEQKRITKSSFW